jgi:hypothetical protein
MLILEIIFILYLLSALNAFYWFPKVEDERFKSIFEGVFTKEFLCTTIPLVPIMNTLICIIYLVEVYNNYVTRRAMKKLVRVLNSMLQDRLDALSDPNLTQKELAAKQTEIESFKKIYESCKEFLTKST